MTAEHGTISPAANPDQELAAALGLLEDAKPRVPATKIGGFETVREALRRADGCAGLPRALIHPDFVPANALATAAGDLVIVDWAGAGFGPRLWSLGFLLWAGGRRGPWFVEDVLAGYFVHVRLDPEELQRLPAVICARPLVLDAWSFATGRERLDDVVDRVERIRRHSDAIAKRVRAAAATA